MDFFGCLPLYPHPCFPQTCLCLQPPFPWAKERKETEQEGANCCTVHTTVAWVHPSMCFSWIPARKLASWNIVKWRGSDQERDNKQTLLTQSSKGGLMNSSAVSRYVHPITEVKGRVVDYQRLGTASRHRAHHLCLTQHLPPLKPHSFSKWVSPGVRCLPCNKHWTMEAARTRELCLCRMSSLLAASLTACLACPAPS